MRQRRIPRLSAKRPSAAKTSLWAQHAHTHAFQHLLESKERWPTLCTGQILSGTTAHHSSTLASAPALKSCFTPAPFPNPHSSPPFGAASSDFPLPLPGSSYGPNRLQSSHSFAPWHSPSGGAGQRATGNTKHSRGEPHSGWSANAQALTHSYKNSFISLFFFKSPGDSCK